MAIVQIYWKINKLTKTLVPALQKIMLTLRNQAWMNRNLLSVKDVLKVLKDCKFTSEAKMAPNVKGFITQMI